MTDRELIQPEQEPVAYVCWSNHKNADGTFSDIRMWLSDKPEGYGHKPLTIPQSKRKWQRLTDEETIEVITDIWGNASIAPLSALAFARAIEAKLREKND